MWRLLLVIVMALTIRSVVRRLWDRYAAGAHPPFGRVGNYTVVRHNRGQSEAVMLYPDVERHIKKCPDCYRLVYNLGGWGLGPKMRMKPPEEVFPAVD